ncbi:phosphoserine aminotransferase%2C (psat) [Campylobacter hyointestinalis subsp. hyointestinalis]|uniref:Phosphoserine aminotransferase, (Psat) n=1 Tax=Campylobacter hyointestinalis subsp. hyointestinalis TaxID=91352 RepID=A0A9W5ER66_CAMHY|nr:phosphoserine aminotransferase%2C (psat) [Campylobacter hyointestinalis subsp. hyointestinalis]CUU85675.1 phosphoserine aminotransferase%2C (psat) [Campylobacter hyointestinalis subsp. hyointestinalis]CUU86098.1 phosphoserine aminotransferase%2C (psat) [Campylobacter hyointestinalis subsp. hyointestinalis]
MLRYLNIVHLTSVHPRYDTRVFIKMCCSLAKNKSYKVSLVVADGKGDEIKSNVFIYDVGLKSYSRISRMQKTAKKIFQKAKDLNSDIYHIHDPELIPVGLRLKKLGKKVIFDSHEDVPKDILSKNWIPFLLRRSISYAYSLYEQYACSKFDYIVAATPFIRDKFLKINKNSIDINNYPILGELYNDISWNDKENSVCYVGGISRIRGIVEIVKAMKYADIKLNLVGLFDSNDLKNEIVVLAKSICNENKINLFGFLDRKGVSDIINKSKIGLVTLYPTTAYLEALPIKMFEYMSAGIPVIASNFPLWRDIVEKSGCGICVDPLKPKDIAKAINFILQNPQIAEQMGINGRKIVVEKYNWAIEEEKLFNIYEELSR